MNWQFIEAYLLNYQFAFLATSIYLRIAHLLPPIYLSSFIVRPPDLCIWHVRFLI